MDYMGIEFAVRARLGRNNWALTIIPKDGRPITTNFIGTRDQAIATAHRSIARWLTQRWDIYLAGTSTTLLGTVKATNADEATSEAAKKFGQPKERLMAVKRG